jgi:long-subunit acyl-CoA synthetase (AMP-forming)
MGDLSSWYPEKVRTGDIGSLCDGFLSVEGRKKNTLITSFGRNISPEWIESVLMSKPMLRQCVVMGDAKPYLTAVICAPVQISDQAIQQWIDTCNESLPDYARLGGWLRVSEQDLKPYMTANGRPQRETINAIYDERLNRLYQSDEGLSLH